MRQITPKPFCRSIELIVMENPNMTGAEIQAEYEFEKACHELWQKEKKTEASALAKDLKTQKYFKIEYEGPTKLIIYLMITNATVDNEAVFFDAVISKISKTLNRFSEIHVKANMVVTYRVWSEYVTGYEKVSRLTKEEYEAFHNKVLGLYAV